MGTMLADTNPWQGLLGLSSPVFGDMAAGACVGLLAKRDAIDMRGTMIAWEATGEGMNARQRPFDGYENVGADMLLVFDEEALKILCDEDMDDPLGAMRRLIRDGNILFYVMKTGKELTKLGYGEFLEALGLAYVGACR